MMWLLVAACLLSLAAVGMACWAGLEARRAARAWEHTAAEWEHTAAEWEHAARLWRQVGSR
jgi:hypothetical protein